MILGAKALAVLDGQPAVSRDHVRQIAPAVLRHRVLPNYQAAGDGVASLERESVGRQPSLWGGDAGTSLATPPHSCLAAASASLSAIEVGIGTATAFCRWYWWRWCYFSRWHSWCWMLDPPGWTCVCDETCWWVGVIHGVPT